MTYFPIRKSCNLEYPFRNLESCEKDINRFFDFSFPGFLTKEPAFLSNDFEPRLDVCDSKDKFIVKADLPGIKKEDVSVTIEDGLLTIKGEKKRSKEFKEDNYMRSERFYGRFSRTHKFSSGINTEKVKAEFNNGVLELVLPKKEESKTKQIKIDLSK